jgi:thymidylate kinase
MNKKTLLERKNKRGVQNKFDKKYLGEFSRIQKNYNDLSKIKINKRIFITIDASQSKELIHQEIIENLKTWKLIK